MATKNKTAATEVAVDDFIDTFAETEAKKQDSRRLVDLMQSWSGFTPKMWGPTIIGFGSYHYKYASGHEGDAPIIGFSPRKAEFSLYVYADTAKSKSLLTELGKYKMGKACIYMKRLDDLNLDVLEKLCKESIAYVAKTYPSGAGS